MITWATRIALGITIAAVTGSLVAGCGSTSTNQSESGCTRLRALATCRVLFIGNSYTYVNDLPGMLTKLASTSGRVVETGILAKGGASLADDVASQETQTALNSARWSVVVLQEQSERPSSLRLRQTQMYPAVHQLVHMIRDAKAQPMFYLTPAHRDGWPENGLFDYASMQSAIDEGYLTIARELHAAVAPVGDAWSATLSQAPHSGLWQADGSHPTREGTYLAACVFYAAIFRQSPKGLRYHAGLPQHDATELQGIASKVVLGDPAKWELR